MPASPPTPFPQLRGPLGAALAIFLLALALNAAFAVEMRGNPFFEEPLSDSAFFLESSARMARGQGFGPEPFYANPLYLLLLTGLRLIGIASTGAVRAVQLTLVALAAPLVFLAGRRMHSTAAGVCGALLLIGYGPLVHAATEIVGTGIEVTLVAATLLALTLPYGYRRHVAVGTLAGLLALSRPTFLLFAFAAAPAVALLRPPGLTVRRGVLHAAVLLGSFIMVIAPVSVRNRVVGGDTVLITSHGGINFYIGNSLQADGRFYAPDGLRENLESINLGSRSLASAAAGRPVKPSEASRYWFGRGVQFLRDNPGKAMSLYARKALLFLHSYEVPTNSDYYLFRERSLVLSLLRIPFAALLAFGLLGFVWCQPRREESVIPLLLMLSQALGIIVTFMASRFRIPLAPVLALGAGMSLCTVIRPAGRRSRATLLLAGGAALAAVLLSVPYPFVREMDLDSRSSQFESLGIHLFDRGDLGEAERILRQAVAFRLGNRAPHWYLARILERRGDPDGAAREWEISARLYGPDSGWGREAWKNLRRLRPETPPLPDRPGG